MLSLFWDGTGLHTAREALYPLGCTLVAKCALLRIRIPGWLLCGFYQSHPLQGQVIATHRITRLDEVISRAPFQGR